MNSDKTVVHMVVGFIGLIALMLAAGLLVLNYQDKTIDPLMATLAGGAVGALTALLASTRGTAKTEEPAPVEVVNTPADPVPTAPTQPLAAPEVSDL